MALPRRLINQASTSFSNQRAVEWPRVILNGTCRRTHAALRVPLKTISATCVAVIKRPRSTGGSEGFIIVVIDWSPIIEGEKGRDGNDRPHRNLVSNLGLPGSAPELLSCLMTLPACVILGDLDVSNVTMRGAWRPLTARLPILETIRRQTVANSGRPARVPTVQALVVQDRNARRGGGGRARATTPDRVTRSKTARPKFRLVAVGSLAMPIL